MKQKQRIIYLPAVDMHVSIREYVKAVRLAADNPDTEFNHGLTCWWPCMGRDIVKQFMAGVHDRINQGIPYMDRGAK
jgi:hypothetical protein